MNSGATAITRKTVSAPTRWMLDNMCIRGDILHYGEGKAYKDTEAFASLPGVTVDAYDPNSEDEAKRVRRCGCSYDLVVCNYVLNVLPSADRVDAFADAFMAATNSIFTVRLDKVNGTPYSDGVMTQRGTFQTQMTSEQWISWFYETLQYKFVGHYRVQVLHKTRSYMIVEVW